MPWLGLNNKGLPLNLSAAIDEVSASVSYIGHSLPGMSTSSPEWRIMKLTVSGSLTRQTFAEGSADFDKIWDNRASYTYS